ncbi:MAG: hypothetical protein GWP61_18020 [Chloroflexi bacterium]|nr:hypothetical protein [Chloroflexota bacterium]
MEPQLIATIIQDVGDQPGMLPLLQYAMTDLFDHRDGQTLTQASYYATGGVRGALVLRADDL